MFKEDFYDEYYDNLDNFRYECCHGDLEFIKKLIERGYDINYDGSDNLGITHTGLMLASACGHLNIVKELINHGANINYINNEYCTALLFASANGNFDIVSELLKNGADVLVNQEAAGSTTALMLACEYGYKEIAEILIDYDANINYKLCNKYTTMYIAYIHGHIDIVKLLYNHGARDSKVNFNL